MQHPCIPCILSTYAGSLLLHRTLLPQVESYFYDIRKQLFDYDQVLNTQVRVVGGGVGRGGRPRVARIGCGGWEMGRGESSM